jgi:primosomal protein N' (replication factor Y)
MLFQLMTQVAGRSGRASLKGEVILQTALPNHPLYQHAQRLDFPSFYREEIEVRKMFRYPPFCHLIKLVFSGESSTTVQTFAEKLRRMLIGKLPSSFEINPIAACGYAKIKNQFRFQCLIKGDATRPVTEFLRGLEPSTKVRLVVDVDPLSTYF